MATRLEFEQTFPGPITQVLALLSDPEFVVAKAEATKAFDIAVEVDAHDDGATVITSTRSMPAEVPSYATAFVGEHLTITETQQWSAPTAESESTATVSVDFHAPLTYRGTITARTAGDSTVLVNRGEFKASVPFVGGKVERVAAEMTEKYLAKEAEVAAAWLTR
jgi:hypothetical protein